VKEVIITLCCRCPALAHCLQEAAREWLDWMSGNKPASSGHGKKLWRQYNEEELQKVSGTMLLYEWEMG
jgi:hypothetical protein